MAGGFFKNAGSGCCPDCVPTVCDPCGPACGEGCPPSDLSITIIFSDVTDCGCIGNVSVDVSVVNDSFTLAPAPDLANCLWNLSPAGTIPISTFPGPGCTGEASVENFDFAISAFCSSGIWTVTVAFSDIASTIFFGSSESPVPNGIVCDGTNPATGGTATISWTPPP